MEKNHSTVSIVMCAYTLERWPDLVRAVTSVQRQTVPASEVILVIDHNPQLYRRASVAFPGIGVIENQEERGLSGARNSGVHQVSGQIVAFIDEDAVASSSWIEYLLQGYSDERILGVGGEVRPLWTTSIPGWFPQEFNWVVGCSYRGLPESLAPIRNPIGCNMSFRAEALLAVGGFRNGMGRIGKVPVGCEETELSIRLRQAYPKASILYQPDAVVYHRVPAGRATWSYFTRRCFAEGRSKAQVTGFVGSNDGLSSERSYSTVTLPQGFLTGLREGLYNRDTDGIKRAGVIVAGLSITTLGYLVGTGQQEIKKLSQRLKGAHSRTPHPANVPVSSSNPNAAELTELQ